MRSRRRAAVVAFALVAAVASVCCAGASGAGVPSAAADRGDAAQGPAASGSGEAPPDFDAAALPKTPDGGAWHAVVEVDPAPSRELFAASDVHGGWDRFAALMAAAGITSGVPSTPNETTWAAGDAIFVVVGDLIDKGPQPLEVIDGLRALEAGAAAAGGSVIVLLGNHEAELFVDPHNSKAENKDGVDQELAARGIDPAAFASGADARGAWLRQRPLAARVGRWFFAHAGNTKGRDVPTLDQVLLAAIALHPSYDDPELVGDDSILEARDWYADAGSAEANAAALGVSHVVFGHDPNAIGPRGEIGVARAGVLFRVDCGMSPDVDDSTGCVLRVRHDDAGVEVAEQLDAKGDVKELWRASTP